MPNCDSMNLGMKVMKAVTMALSAVYDRLTNKNVTLLRILTAALGKSGEGKKKVLFFVLFSLMSEMLKYAKIKP